MERMNRRDRSRGNIETVGNYEYENKDRLGLGAFAIVFKGCAKSV